MVILHDSYPTVGGYKTLRLGEYLLADDLFLVLDRGFRLGTWLVLKGTLDGGLAGELQFFVGTGVGLPADVILRVEVLSGVGVVHVLGCCGFYYLAFADVLLQHHPTTHTREHR